MKKIAILIAVEQYSDPDIEDVAYARRDAEVLSAALELHGFDKADQLVLVDGQATKTVIESKVKKALGRLKPDDILHFYYAGHGFCAAGQNYLTSHDTQSSDREDTSVALEPIIEQLERSKCQRVVLLLDCRAGDAGTAPSMFDNLDKQAIEDALDGSDRCVCFAACGSDETSYVSNTLKHGIWAHHLIEALLGNAPLALEKGLLLCSSLQNYLQTEVSRTLRATYTGTQTQTPWTYGAANDFALADLRPILQQRREAAVSGASLVTEVSFIAKRIVAVKTLTGWKKSYRIPDQASDSSESFVVGIAASELKEDLDSVYDKLKEAFGFARRDLDASAPADGRATIVTPHFNYSISVTLNPTNASEVVWTRIVDAIKTPQQVESKAFGQVFNGMFDTLEFSLPTRVNLTDFIDAVEAASIPDLKIKYDRELTYCDLQIKGAVGAVRLTSRELSIVHNRPRETKVLIQSFDAVKSVVCQHHLPLISFAAPGDT